MEELSDCIPDREDGAEDVKRCISDYLTTLNRNDRIMFIQRYWYNLTSEQVGRELGMTSGAVRTRLHRIREGLRIYLEERGHYV